MNGWGWFAVYYVVAGVGFGVHQATWVRDRRAKGLPVEGPVGQFVFVVLAAPLAIAIAAAFAWFVLLAVLGLLGRL